MRNELIVRSIELAAERCDDLTPRVFARLFALCPEMQAMFRKEAKDLVKGEMLAQTLQVILDFTGERRYGAHMIQCEVQSHHAYGVPPETFDVFFGVVRDTIRDLLGPDWSQEMARAWEDLLDELGCYATHPDQQQARAFAQ